MCGQPTSCCRIALRHHLLITRPIGNTCFLSLKRFIKVTEGHYRNPSLFQEWDCFPSVLVVTIDGSQEPVLFEAEK